MGVGTWGREADFSAALRDDNKGAAAGSSGLEARWVGLASAGRAAQGLASMASAVMRASRKRSYSSRVKGQLM